MIRDGKSFSGINKSCISMLIILMQRDECYFEVFEVISVMP